MSCIRNIEHRSETGNHAKESCSSNGDVDDVNPCETRQFKTGKESDRRQNSCFTSTKISLLRISRQGCHTFALFVASTPSEAVHISLSSARASELGDVGTSEVKEVERATETL